jgi:plastocyanin
MPLKKTSRSFPVLFLLLAALLLVGAGCGGGDSNEEASTATSEATEPESASEDSETTTEAGDDSGGNAPAPSGDAVRSAKVEIDDFSYNPDPVTIEEGGKVIWINKDSVAHTATAEDGSFDTGTLEEGKLKSETFKQPGTYRYVCSIHPEMHGTVEVVEG